MSKTKLTNSQKKDYAEMLYLQNQLTQKEIAARVGTSSVTMSKWVNEGNWESLRRALLTSKKEILQNLYRILDKINMKLNKEGDEGIGDSKIADMYVKYTSAIRNLETETSIAEKMDAGKQFHEYLQKIDAGFALVFLNHYDAFIKAQL